MFKGWKKVATLSLSVFMAVTSVAPAFAAKITWDPSDLSETPVLFDENFEVNSDPWNGTLDDQTFKDDSDHNIVTMKDGASGHLSFRNDPFKAQMATQKGKVYVKFDYYAEAPASGTPKLRVEFRDMVKINGSEKVGQKDYWSMDGNRTEDTNIKTGQWNTFEGTFDLGAYMSAWNTQEGFSMGSPYMYFRVENCKFYLDNVHMTADSSIKVFNEPSVIYEDGWTKQPDEAQHKNIYKNTISVAASQTSKLALRGNAPGFFEAGKQYQISFWFKEDAANANNITRMWRFLQDRWDNSGNMIAQMYYCGSAAAAPTKGEWVKVTQTFTADTTNDKIRTLVNNGVFSLRWECRAGDGGEDWAYNTGLNGDYSIYIADFSITGFPSVNSNTVAFDETQSVPMGEGVSIPVSGYFDETKAPILTVDGKPYTGVWENVVMDPNVDQKYRTGNAVFAEATQDQFLLEENAGSLSLTDIWGKVNTNPVTVVFAREQSFELETLNGGWENVFSKAEQAAGDGLTWLGAFEPGDFFEDGLGLVRFSFDVKKNTDTEYTDASFIVQLRSGSGGEVTYNVPWSDLADMETHSYSMIFDLGSMDRYYASGSAAIDRNEQGFRVVLRNKTTADVTYSNLKVDRFNTTALEKNAVVARLKITNNGETPFTPGGMLMFAKYNGSQLEQLKARTVPAYANTESNGVALNNAISKDESKWVYITGYEAENGRTSSQLETYDSNCTYKAFYWDSLANRNSIAKASEQ